MLEVTAVSESEPGAQAFFLPTPVGPSAALGERALIALFRGAGSLLGSSSGSGVSGMDTLYGRLQQQFSDYFWVGQVFDSYTGNVFNFQEVGHQQGLLKPMFYRDCSLIARGNSP